MQGKSHGDPSASDLGMRRAPLGLSYGLKATCRRMLAAGLYHTGLVSGARRLALSHELNSRPGSNWPRLRRFDGSKFAILCYHRVGTEGVPLFSRLEPGVFASQMRYIRQHYRVVSLGQMCGDILSGRNVRPTVSITFDDGYRDLYTHAFPVLQNYEIPATIYLIGESMESGQAPWYDRIFVALDVAPGPVLELQIGAARRFILSSFADRAAAAWEIVCYLRSIPDSERRKWCQQFEKQIPIPRQRLERRILDWEQVRAMQKSGISFGAHTMTHPSVSRLDAPELETELGHSKRLLEDGLGEAVEDFAYPFGKPSDCSLAAEECLGKHRYRSAVTTTDGCNLKGDNLYRLRRLQIGDQRSMSSFAFTLSLMFLETTEGPQPAPARAIPFEGLGTRAETSEGRL